MSGTTTGASHLEQKKEQASPRRSPAGILIKAALGIGTFVALPYGAATFGTSLLEGVLSADISARVVQPSPVETAQLDALWTKAGRDFEYGGLALLVGIGAGSMLMAAIGPKSGEAHRLDHQRTYLEGQEKAHSKHLLGYVDEHRDEIAAQLRTARKAAIPSFELGGWYGSTNPAELRIVPTAPAYHGDGTLLLGLHTPDAIKVCTLPRPQYTTADYDY